MKVFLLLLVLMIGMAAAAQRGWTDGFSPRANQSYVVEDGNLSARNQFFTPRYDDTTEANDNILVDTLGQIIYTYHPHAFWGRVYSGGSNMWIQIPMTPATTYTASEGLLLSGADFRFGGPIGSPTNFSTNRVINTNRLQMYWTNGAPVTNGGAEIFPGQPNWSPIQILTEDTLVENTIDPPTAAMPFSGLYAQRILYYADGILKTQKVHGHTISMVNNFKDTMTFWNQGGDYNAGVKIEREILPRGTGRQATGVHGTNAFLSPFNSTPTLLVNTFLRNSGSNYIYTNGWLAGVTSYLVTGAGDTVSRFSYFQTGIFSSGNVKKMYGLDFQHSVSGSGGVDSSWGLWDQYGYRHYLRGNVKIGILDSTVTGYQFKVGGASYFNGLIQGKQATQTASTAGVLTLPNNGNVVEITGTNTITAINNTNLKDGFIVRIVFASTATLTDGTANSGAAIGMELEGNTNFVGTADDIVVLVLCTAGGTQRWRMSGKSVN